MKLLNKKVPVKKVAFTVLNEKALHQVKGGVVTFPDELELSG